MNMQKSTDKNSNHGKKQISSLEIITAVVCAYISAVCTVPTSGIFTSIPITLILAVVASFICKKRIMIYTCMFVCPIVLNALNRVSVVRCIVVGVVCLGIAFFAILAKRGLLTAIYASKNKREIFSCKAPCRKV